MDAVVEVTPAMSVADVSVVLLVSVLVLFVVSVVLDTSWETTDAVVVSASDSVVVSCCVGVKLELAAVETTGETVVLSSVRMVAGSVVTLSVVASCETVVVASEIKPEGWVLSLVVGVRILERLDTSVVESSGDAGVVVNGKGNPSEEVSVTSVDVVVSAAVSSVAFAWVTDIDDTVVLSSLVVVDTVVVVLGSLGVSNDDGVVEEASNDVFL